MGKTIVTAQSLNVMLMSADEAKRIEIIGRALVALFERQTDNEKTVNDTQVWNTVGFSGADGKSGTLTAKYFLKHKTLLEWQVERWMKVQRNGMPRICKYWKQLNDVAARKAAAAKTKEVVC